MTRKITETIKLQMDYDTYTAVDALAGMRNRSVEDTARYLLGIGMQTVMASIKAEQQDGTLPPLPKRKRR